MKINYLIGNAVNPIGSGHKVIAHICNDIGKWGKGFVLAVSRKWPNTREQYLEWYNNGLKLGEVQYLRVETYITVANMIGQHGIRTGSNGPPIRYDALEKCLANLKLFAEENKASVHIPRIGCGLAGGSWSKIEEILNRVFNDSTVEVNVYTLPDEINKFPTVEYK